jgi:NRAMP (natural resistance-associated macrophage protein)-like metal ion transporter
MLGLKHRISRRRLPYSRLLLLFSILGPGIIAANADNDAGGIYQYSLAGAQYGFGMLWVLVLVTISLGVCQEMGARMGAVTGKGLADLIREEYGVRMTLFAMATLLIANYATTVSEFAGISAAVEIFAPAWCAGVAHKLIHPIFHVTPVLLLNPDWAKGIVRWIAVPVTAAGVWLLVTRGTYKRVERILLFASLIYLSYIVSAIMASPPWGKVLHQTVWPDWHGVRIDREYIFMVIALIGTTITPWGQFYIQSSVRDKGIRPDEYKLTRADVLFGAFFTNFIAFFIIVCCGVTLFNAGQKPNFDDAGQIALALKPFVKNGQFATLLFAFGLFNASCFGAITVPLSTAYAVTESLGSESGVGRRTREAPMFVTVFAFQLIVAAVTVLVGGGKLSLLIILPNIVGGVLLPIVLILTLRLINEKRLMGEFTNSRAFNVIAVVTTVIVICLSVTLLVQAVHDILFHRAVVSSRIRNNSLACFVSPKHVSNHRT